MTRGYLGVAQLVARYLGVVEAASSSLVTQTSGKPCFPYFYCLYKSGTKTREIMKTKPGRAARLGKHMTALAGDTL